MSRGGIRGLVPWCGLAATLLVARPAAAGNDDSNALFDAGVLQMEAGRYAQACPSIEHSYELDPRPGVLYTLAECQSKWGHLAAAVARYQEYLAAYAALPPTKKKLQTSRPNTARAQIAALSPQIPKLTLTLAPGAPTGTLVERDGHPVAASDLGASMSLDPGDHLVRVSVPSGRMSEIHVTLARSESRRVALDFPRAPPEGTSSHEGPRPTSGRRVAAVVSGGLGLAGLVLGGAMGGVALAKKSVVDAHCNVGGIPEACDHTGKAAADELQPFALASTVGLAAGAALVVLSTVLFVTEPSPPKPPAGAWWIKASVAPLGAGGTTGVAVLLQGTW
ncbi:MAG: tetratricopeptide repeat protein [Byssovorax sp.]